MSQHEAQRLIEQLAAYRKKVTVDRKTALAALVRAGLVTTDGHPTEPYAPVSNGTPRKPRTRPASR